MGLYRKVNGQLENIAGANGSGLPIGTYIEYNGDTAPNGYLKADGSVFDETKYPELYVYLGTNVLPTKYSDINDKPSFQGTNRTNYNGGIPVYTDVATILRAAGIDHDGPGFAADGLFVYQSGTWEMLYFENTDGTHYCVTQVPYTDSDGCSVTIPVKKGQKVYAIMRSSASSDDAVAGSYQNPAYTYINIYYYTKYKCIKAVSGLITGSGESIEVASAINTATEGLEQYIVDNCEQLVQDALNAIASHYVVLPLYVTETRTVNIDSNQLAGINYKFRQTFADQATGTWTIKNTGNYDISVSRYGGRGTSAVDRVVTFSTIAAGASETFILDSDDPYLDSNTFSIEAIRCS